MEKKSICHALKTRDVKVKQESLTVFWGTATSLIFIGIVFSVFLRYTHVPHYTEGSDL